MPRKNKRASLHHGLLVVDKQPGCTSHDVVSAARRVLRTRSIGHAGTLDPMATGVLLLAVGEGTKVVRYLVGHDKTYDATIALGSITNTLDKEGEVIETAPVPEGLTQERVETALAELMPEYIQQVPKVSAVKVDGVALHKRARKGEVIDAPKRVVQLHAFRELSVESPTIRLTVDVGSGFYVRALARDLAARLGTLGHLTALRRTAVGKVDVSAATVTSDELFARMKDDAPELPALVPLSELVATWGAVHLNNEGEQFVGHGKPLTSAQVARTEGDVTAEPLGLFAPSGRLLAVGRPDKEGYRIARGLHLPDASEA